ncbi:MAG: HAMP domain-containing protein [Magnetococcales bacterium]|nr:HAMP domain-containing protein [Magnetococcales bacterium]
MPQPTSPLHNMRLRGKSLILIGVMALGFLAVSGIVGSHLNDLRRASIQNQRIDQVSMLIGQVAFGTFELQQLMTHFLQIGANPGDPTDPPDTAIKQKIATIETSIATLDKALALVEHSPALLETAQPLRTLQHLLSQLKEHDLAVMELQQEIGQDEDSGIQGRLRTQVHLLESELTQRKDFPCLVDLLQLRRREKDFLMRGHRASRAFFDKTIHTLRDTLKTLPDSGMASEVVPLTAYFQNYEKEAERLKQVLPLIASHRKRLWEINNAILTQATRLTESNQQLLANNAQIQQRGIERATFSLVISLSVIFLVIGWLTLWFFQHLLAPIHRLREMASRMAAGEGPEPEEAFGRDEIGDLARSLLQVWKKSPSGPNPQG